MTDDRHTAVERYIHELAIALADMLADERDDVIAGVREHIETSLAELPEPSPDDVQRVLDELGDPLTIAADTGSAGALPRHESDGPVNQRVAIPLLQRDWIPAATVLSLTLGAFLFWLIVPIAFWLLGLVLLWLSPLWRVGEKVLGTFVVGVGPAVMVALSLFATFSVGEVCSSSGGTSTGVIDSATGADVEQIIHEECTSTGTPWVGRIAAGLLIIAIVAVAVLLWRRGAARVPRAPEMARSDTSGTNRSSVTSAAKGE